MVKTFSSGDAAVLEISQRDMAYPASALSFSATFSPQCLRLFFNALTHPSHVVHIPTHVLPFSFFIYDRIHLVQAYPPFTSTTMPPTTTTVNLLMLFCFLSTCSPAIPSIFPETIPMPLSALDRHQTQPSYDCLWGPKFRMEPLTLCPAAVSGDGYWLGPKPPVQSRHMRMPFESGVTSG